MRGLTPYALFTATIAAIVGGTLWFWEKDELCEPACTIDDVPLRSEIWSRKRATFECWCQTDDTTWRRADALTGVAPLSALHGQELKTKEKP